MRLLILFFCLSFFACGNGGPSTTIKATLPDSRYDGTYAILEKRDILGRNFPQRLDSVLIEGGRFSIDFIADTMPSVFEVVIPAAIGPHHNLPVVIDSRNIALDYDDLGVSARGGKITDRYNELILNKRRDIEIQKNSIVAERDELQDKGTLSHEISNEYNNRLSELYLTQMPGHTQFVRENKDNPAGWYFFFSTALSRYAEQDLAELYAAMPDTLTAKYEEIQKTRQDKQAYFQLSQKISVPGNPAREITGSDPDGNKISLSDLRGKVVLVDIWASWCVPCIQEIPEFIELYDKYRDEGFEILGFSMDLNEEAWTKAVERHAIPWISISDLKGWDSPVPADYGINAIPFTILVDRDGTIAGRNLHAHNLVAALEKLFPGK